MRKQFFVTVASDLIAGLEFAPATHWRKGLAPKLAAFGLTSREQGMFPAKLKIKDRARPVEGEIYICMIADSPRSVFTDRSGRKCVSRDMFDIRLYLPGERGIPESCGELRFTRFPKGQDVQISPAPIFIQRMDGVKERGALWIAQPGVDYQVSFTGRADEVIWTGNVQVDLNPEDGRQIDQSGTVRYEADDSELVVYDHRHNKEDETAHAEHIRRTLDNGRSYEFINLRRHCDAGVVEHVVSSSGIAPNKEVMPEWKQTLRLVSNG